MPIDTQEGSRLLIHPRGVEGAHDFLGNSANTDLIRQAKGKERQAPVPTPTLKTNDIQEEETQFQIRSDSDIVKQQDEGFADYYDDNKNSRFSG